MLVRPQSGPPAVGKGGQTSPGPRPRGGDEGTPVTFIAAAHLPQHPALRDPPALPKSLTGNYPPPACSPAPAEPWAPVTRSQPCPQAMGTNFPSTTCGNQRLKTPVRPPHPCLRGSHGSEVPAQWVLSTLSSPRHRGSALNAGPACGSPGWTPASWARMGGGPGFPCPPARARILPAPRLVAVSPWEHAAESHDSWLSHYCECFHPPSAR